MQNDVSMMAFLFDANTNLTFLLQTNHVYNNLEDAVYFRDSLAKHNLNLLSIST